jgi:hyperosmotically inducible protein
MRVTRAAVLVALLAAAPAVWGCGKSVQQTVDDSGLSTRVKTALLNAPDVAANDISVSAQGGVVTLSGSVRSAEERERAVAIARQVSGVSEVTANVQVATP